MKTARLPSAADEMVLFVVHKKMPFLFFE